MKPSRCLTRVVLILALTAAALAVENLDRGLVAVQKPDGSVFLSWRLLKADRPNIQFRLYRTKAGSDERTLLTGEPYSPTCFTDTTPDKSATYTYELQRNRRGERAAAPAVLATTTINLSDTPKPYLSIPLAGDYDFQKVGVGDLDGDGVLEFLIKQPNFNTDPYQQPGYWKKSTTTYKIEAYTLSGKLLWRHDMGWSIEAGIWYSPWVIYDLDGDGRAEVYCKAGEGDPRDEKGLVQTGPEWLIKLDGRTGEVLAKTDWLGRDGYGDYNYYCRNFLAVAYLDGKTPSLIMQRGTYNLIRIRALDKDFNTIWNWETTQEAKKYSGQSGHGLITADVDNDGRDELVIGAAVIDDNGRGLWTLEIGHPDAFYVADIVPDNPGLECFFGIEPRRPKNGLMVVDAATGRILWGHGEPTFHVHGQGMAADILAEHPGMEVYAGERDYKKRWLYSADGKLLNFYEDTPLAPRALWWDADPQKEVVIGRTIRNWPDETIQELEGSPIVVMDCLGDWREEVVTALKGELRIYTTTIPTEDRRTCLLQDHQYRLGVAAQTMGYYYPATLGLQQ